MNARIDGPRLAPAAGGAPQQLVIFLHGYGSSGNDLIQLGPDFAEFLPHAAFSSPHAPEELPAFFFTSGYQWFALETWTEDEWEEGVRRMQPVLEAFIHAEAARYELPLSAVALVGFSQGTMMALQTGLRLSETLAAIVGFSGHLAGAARLAAEIKAKPPVLLIHGSSDEVIPVPAIHHARATLAAAGVPVEWHIRPGLGHGIDLEGLKAAGQFLHSAFAKA
jgi:phospholipase/carboxylesterase